MALIACRECNKEISDKAISCPNCGMPLQGVQPVHMVHEPKKGTPVLVWVFIVAVAGFAGMFLLGSVLSLGDDEKIHLENLIEDCRKTQNELIRKNPGSHNFNRMCDKLDFQYREKYGSYYPG